MKTRFRSNINIQFLTEDGSKNAFIINSKYNRGDLVQYNLKLDDDSIVQTNQNYLNSRKNNVELYFFNIEGTNLFKIGISKNTKYRLKQVQSYVNEYYGKDIKVNLISNTNKSIWHNELEKYLHHLYRNHQILDKSFNSVLGYEWFKFDDTIVNELKSIYLNDKAILSKTLEFCQEKTIRIKTAMMFDTLHILFFKTPNKLNAQKTLNVYRRFLMSKEEFINWLTNYIKELEEVKTPKKALEFIDKNNLSYDGVENFTNYKYVFNSIVEIKPFYLKRLKEIIE